MKHTLKITIILVLIFFTSQIIGLGITSQYIEINETRTINETTGETIVLKNLTYSELPYIQRPEVEESASFIYIMSAILIGTVLVLILIKFKKFNLWRYWFFFAVWLTLTVSFGAFIPNLIALAIALIFAALKIFRPSIVIHNFTEMFIYGGLAAIFVPIMNLFAAIALLVLISGYDMYAVWKSKHMIKLAKFTTDSKVFAGLSIPYKMPKKPKPSEKLKKIKSKVAILGGGDIGFPLIFTGVVMKGLILDNFFIGFLKASIISVFISLALLWLLIKGEKNKFYPAMPYLSVGCIVGWAIVLLLP